MKAADIYRVLDEAGLTPPVHWHAAPFEWQVALEKIEREIEEDRFDLARAIAAHGSPLPVAPAGQIDLSALDERWTLHAAKLATLGATK